MNAKNLILGLSVAAIGLSSCCNTDVYKRQIFSYISILLAGLGLFGLAWFSVENRRKEISLRKINGASENQIAVLLCARFIKWILIAFCIGAPIAYYCSAQWLTQFVYKDV